MTGLLYFKQTYVAIGAWDIVWYTDTLKIKDIVKMSLSRSKLVISCKGNKEPPHISQSGILVLCTI